MVRLGAPPGSASKLARSGVSLCRARPPGCGGVTGGSVAREDCDSGSSEDGASLAGATVSRAALLCGASTPDELTEEPLAEPGLVVLLPVRDPWSASEPLLVPTELSASSSSSS